MAREQAYNRNRKRKGYIPKRINTTPGSESRHTTEVERERKGHAGMLFSMKSRAKQTTENAQNSAPKRRCCQ